MLTPERLTDLVIQADRETLCQEMANLTEAEREKIAEAALQLFKQVDAIGLKSVKEKDTQPPDDKSLLPLIEGMHKVQYSDWRLPRLTAALAVLGLCDLKVLQAYMGSWFCGDVHDMPQRVLQILSQRRPPWLQKFVDKERKQAKDWARGCMAPWMVDYKLTRLGLVKANESNFFVEDMVYGLGSMGSQFEVSSDCIAPWGTRYEEILADTHLLEHQIWRLFEVDNKAFVYTDFGWPADFLRLSTEGHLDRMRLITACLKAMAGELSTTMLAGLAKFHDLLNPTIDERAALQEQYLLLMRSKNVGVITSVLNAIEQLVIAKRVEPASFLEPCKLVFEVDKKAPAEKALKIIARLIKEQPSCRQLASKSIVCALAHSSPDIQEKGLAALEGMKDQLAEISDQLLALQDTVAAVYRPRISALVAGSPETASEKVVKAASASPAAPPQVTGSSDRSLVARAKAVKRELLQLSGVETAMRALEEGNDPSSFDVAPYLVPRCLPGNETSGIDNIDDLIFSVSALVEGSADATEFERIIDAIPRFHAEKPADFDRKVSDLRKRVEKRSRYLSGTMMEYSASVGLLQLIHTWLGLEIPQTRGPRNNTERFMCFRVDEITARLNHASCLALPLLSSPSHKDGWLDPTVLVERVKSYLPLSEKRTLITYDLAQALLRLTPDRRREALERAADLHENSMEMTRLRFALGSDLAMQCGDGAPDLLMLAAVHSRLSVDPTARALVSFDVPCARLNDDGGKIEVHALQQKDPAIPFDIGQALAYRYDGEMISGPGYQDWLYQWACFIWPMNLAPLYLMQLTFKFHNNLELVKVLSDPDRAWTQESTRLAAWALNTSHAVGKVAVADAMIDGINSMCIDPQLVGRHLATISAQLKLNRVGVTLSDIAKVSVLHHWAVFEIIDSLVANVGEVSANLHAVLTPYLESGIESGMAPSPGAQAVLSSVSGGKAGKLAKQLLALKNDSSRRLPAREAWLEACLARAERWQTASPTVAVPAGR